MSAFSRVHGPHPIADPGLRLDEVPQPALHIRGGELATELAHVDVDVAVLAAVGLAPHRPQDAALRDDSARVPEQDPQDLELTRRQLDGPAGDAGLVALDVQDERPGGQSPGAVPCGTGPAPECGTDAGLELVDAERLRHVVVGPTLQGLDLLGLGVSPGEDDDRRPGVAPDAAD